MSAIKELSLVDNYTQNHLISFILSPRYESMFLFLYLFNFLSMTFIISLGLMTFSRNYGNFFNFRVEMRAKVKVA